MKKIIPIAIMLTIFATGNAQTITHARFILSRECNTFSSIDLEINEKYLISISESGRIQYLARKDGSDLFEEDCRELGIPISFFDSSDIHDIPGLIKSIGGIQIAYNNRFDIHDVSGTIKSIGDIQIKYYNRFDLNDPKGKVKSVGNVLIKYYNSFDRDDWYGEIKSIEGNNSRLAVMGPVRRGWH